MRRFDLQCGQIDSNAIQAGMQILPVMSQATTGAVGNARKSAGIRICTIGKDAGSSIVLPTRDLGIATMVAR